MSIGTRENLPITGNRDPNEGYSRLRKFSSIIIWLCVCQLIKLEGRVLCWNGSVTVCVWYWIRFTLCAEQSRNEVSLHNSIPIRLILCPLSNLFSLEDKKEAIAREGQKAVLRIRIRDLVPFWPLDPGSRMGKKSRWGSVILDEHPWSYFREIKNNFLA